MSAASLFPEPPTQRELDERLAAAVTSYGVGTHSYNNSAEKREMDRQRAAATKRHLNAAREEIVAPLTCRCPQRPWPHELSVHRLLRYESRYAISNEPVMKWPWTLRFLGNMDGEE